ncbi:MAG: OFA family MFS transporter [Cuniculiplasma sp.]|jgi:OFA family oxalate/formate antiporter-like MFS transporter|nr:OFA family MFS transporter [Cuniculiplasma sp.]
MKKGFLVIGILIMSMNSLYQYSWNVFEPLLKTGLGVTLIQVQVGFSLFAIFSTGFQGVGGYFADKKGPRNIGIISSILSAAGFIGTSVSGNLAMFYIFWSLGSIGEGILYGIATNLAVKWFKENRGLAVGFVSFGFGLGAAVANIFLLKATSFREPMLIIGLTELILFPILLSKVRYPEKQVTGDRPSRNLRNRRFWILYVSFVLGAVPLIVISSSLGILGKRIPILEFTILVSLFPLLSGISRPILGFFSDRIGRIRMVSIIDIFLIIGSLLLLNGYLLESIVLIGFFGGSMISQYMSLIGDIFGTKFSTSNNGVFYTGKAISGFIGSAFFSALFIVNETESLQFILICVVVALGFLLLSTYEKGRPGKGTIDQEMDLK